MQTDFIAIYRGQTVADARLVAVTAEPNIVGRFVQELVGQESDPSDKDTPNQRGSLRLVRDAGE